MEIPAIPDNWINALSRSQPLPDVQKTCNLDHIKRHYYMSHPKVNPTRIVPKGPILNLEEPHGRDRFV